MAAHNKSEWNKALSEAVREFGRPSTPSELVERGVQNLRCVSTGDVALMIEKAVNRTLMERTLGVGAHEMGALIDEAQASILGLLQGAKEVEESRGTLLHQREDLQHELDSMREERHGRPAARELALQLEREAKDTERKLRVAIRAAFETLDWRQPVVARAEDHVIADVLAIFASLRSRDVELIHARDDQIDRLERRVAKLVLSLETTERTLNRVAAMKNIDLGIASLFRVVQGLSPEDENALLKKQMMELIFKANVELQEKRSAVG